MIANDTTTNGYIFEVMDLDLNDELRIAIERLDAFLGPFDGEPDNNVLSIYEIDGCLAAEWTHVPTDSFIYQDGSWIDQNAD